MALFWNWYFQTVLAASGGLDVTFGGYHYLKPLEVGRNGFSYSKKTWKWHITCVNVKNNLGAFLRSNLASGGLRFEKCPTLVANYWNTAQMWMMSEGMRLIAQEGTTMAPLPYVIWRPPNVLWQPTYISLITILPLASSPWLWAATIMQGPLFIL